MNILSAKDLADIGNIPIFVLEFDPKKQSYLVKGMLLKNLNNSRDKVHVVHSFDVNGDTGAYNGRNGFDSLAQAYDYLTKMCNYVLVTALFVTPKIGK